MLSEYQYYFMNKLLWRDGFNKNMVSKIYFHVGDRKTGSTAIQVALAQKSWSGGGPSLEYMSDLNNRALSTALYLKDRKKFLKPQFEKLAKKIDNSNADIAIVSDEAFEDVNPAVLAEAIETYMPQHSKKVHVLAYVRPHADRIRASYTQTTKLGINTRTVENFVENAITTGKFEYTPRFCAWRDQFADQFTLRPMIRSELVDQDVVRDFFHILLEGAAFDYTPDETTNSALSFADLMMLRDFHMKKRKKSYPTLKKNRERASWHLSRVLEAMPSDTAGKMLFPRAVNGRIAAYYCDDARQLDQEFFGKPLMETALAGVFGISASTPPSYDVADHLDDEGQRLTALLGQLADDLLARNPDKWQGHFRKVWLGKLGLQGPREKTGRKTGGRQIKGQ